MATNKKLRTALLDQLNVTPQRLYQLVKKIKLKNGPMSTEDAIYVIAHQKGFDLTKFLDATTIDRVRGLLPNSVSNLTNEVTKKSYRRRTTATHAKININGALPNIDAFLTSTIMKDAKEMAELYPVYYIFENSLRIVIRRIMEKKHDKKWWDKRVSKPVKTDVSRRKDKESKQPWHGKRGQHDIFYCNFGDLKAIIEKNWDDFKELFPSRPWITQKLEELEHPRNILAHHNPVGKTDQDRIKLYFHDWTELLESRKNIIP